MQKVQDSNKDSSLARKEILEKLSERKWFQNTEEEIKDELRSLPPDFDGFLFDLANHPDDYEGLDILRLVKFATGNFISIPVFEVRSKQTNQIFTYEYASFKFGKFSGFRGILLLEVEGRIEYFVLKWTKKFSTGTWVYDTIGDFIQFTGGRLLNFPKKVEEEIKSELGLKELRVKRFIDLGQLNTDVTLTNRHVSLFAAIIDANDSERLKSIEDKILETKKISFGLKIIPIKLLNDYVHTVEDSYFLACILRLVSIGIIHL